MSHNHLMKSAGFIDILFLIFFSTVIVLFGVNNDTNKQDDLIKTQTVSPVPTSIIDGNNILKPAPSFPINKISSPKPITSPDSAQKAEYFCTVPCGGMAGEAIVQNNCAKLTTQEQCTSYRYTDYPFSCSWQAVGTSCPAYP